MRAKPKSPTRPERITRPPSPAPPHLCQSTYWPEPGQNRVGTGSEPGRFTSWSPEDPARPCPSPGCTGPGHQPNPAPGPNRNRCSMLRAEASVGPGFGSTRARNRGDAGRSHGGEVTWNYGERGGTGRPQFIHTDNKHLKIESINTTNKD